MKNNLFLLAFLCLTMALSGCLKDPECPYASGRDGGTLRMTLSIGNMEKIETRSAAASWERSIKNLMVLIFDKTTGKYNNGEIIAPENLQGEDGDQLRMVTLNLIPVVGDKVVVVANYDPRITTIPLIQGTSTTVDINKQFSYTGIIDNKVVMPMSGEFIYSASGMLTCQMIRSLCKVQLNISENLEVGRGLEYPFEMKGWLVYNGLDLPFGAIYSESPTACTVKPGVTDSSFATMSTTPQPNGSTFYLPEYPCATKAKTVAVSDTQFHKDRFGLIITTTGGRFYRIDLFDHKTGKFIDMRRNTHINVTMTKVFSDGYGTIEEALAAPGSNLEYEIKVEGDNDNIVISNGQYALSLEYDEVIYTGDGTTEVSLGQVRSIDTSGVGLPSVKTITASSGVTLTGATLISATAQELKAKMSGTSGTITLKLGNIERTLKLIRSDIIPASGKTITLTGDYSNVIWTKHSPFLNIRPDGTSSAQLVAWENVIPTNASALSDPAVVPVFDNQAEGYLLRAGVIPGCTKITIEQAVPKCVGWFGGAPDNSGGGRYSKRLIVDSHEPTTSKQWYINTSVKTNVTNKETGLDNTKALMAQSAPANYKAAHYCYLLNDRNGNGQIDADESVDWYLPAQNQLMGFWVVNEGDGMSFRDDFYWSSTENSGYYSWYEELGSGYTNSYGTKTASFWVRCCRDL